MVAPYRFVQTQKIVTLLSIARSTTGKYCSVAFIWVVTPIFFVFCLGGLGEAVIAAVAKEKEVIVETLAVREIPRSGPGDVLMDQYGIGAKTIVKTVKSM